MAKTITPQALRRAWSNNHEIALVDVREEGLYALSHPFFALTIPISELEVKLPPLVPRLSAPVVVYDSGQGYTTPAAKRILDLGYSDVAILEGGLEAYAKVGEVFRDVNVPSKAFGELVEAIRATPSLPAEEVKKAIDNKDDVVILDARRYEEYHTMCLPNSRSCPGGELLHRVFEAAPDPNTTVIVHCAGRTRSIVGTQSLVNAGIDNKVVALENGTIGWTLAGFELEKGKVERIAPPSVRAAHKARSHASRWARHVGVPFIDVDQLSVFIAQAEERTLYLLDVRDPEEYANNHLEGFTSAPGGQLVQATDEWVGVRGARIVLNDTDGVRALMTASWLLQLGWDVSVLEEDAKPTKVLSPTYGRMWNGPPTVAGGWITVEDVKKLRDATIIDLARSPVYRKGHIPNAYFASGPDLGRDLASLLKRQPTETGPIILTSPDGLVAAANISIARSILASSERMVYFLKGGTAAWTAEGGDLDTEGRWLSEPVDVYKRPYEGTDNAAKNMQDYIDWEHGLVAQVANDGVANFHVVRGIES